jgi:hypothetical protein
MSVTIDDLKPKNFKINVKGVELECKPLRLSHTLVLAKIGEVFKDPKTASKNEIANAENDLNEIFGELIPEIKGIQLDMQSTLEVMTQMMETIEPSDNKELAERGVKFNDDPKAERTG